MKKVFMIHAKAANNYEGFALCSADSEDEVREHIQVMRDLDPDNKYDTLGYDENWIESLVGLIYTGDKEGIFYDTVYLKI